jgi:hypothetical protein
MNLRLKVNIALFAPDSVIIGLIRGRSHFTDKLYSQGRNKSFGVAEKIQRTVNVFAYDIGCA